MFNRKYIGSCMVDVPASHVSFWGCRCKYLAYNIQLYANYRLFKEAQMLNVWPIYLHLP